MKLNRLVFSIQFIAFFVVVSVVFISICWMFECVCKRRKPYVSIISAAVCSFQYILLSHLLLLYSIVSIVYVSLWDSIVHFVYRFTHLRINIRHKYNSDFFSVVCVSSVHLLSLSSSLLLSMSMPSLPPPLFAIRYFSSIIYWSTPQNNTKQMHQMWPGFCVFHSIVCVSQ